MPIRFFRHLLTGPFRMNLSSRGVSNSFGGRGLWLIVSSRHSRTNVGLPGTGLNWYQQRRFPPPANDDARPHRSDWTAVAMIIAAIIGTVVVIWR